jgi:glycine/D-amino acid oxidase-like deaminating enzyme
MSATRYGIPYWTEGAKKVRPVALGRLRGEVVCDVVVVGGGLSGCLNAYMFAHAGVQTVLVEADHLARGSTSGAPGMIDGGAGARMGELSERHGPKIARTMREMERHAALDLQALIHRLKIQCELERLDVIDVAHSPTETALLQREQRALQEAGLETAWMPGKRARTAAGPDATVVLKRADGGSADPQRLALGFAHHAGLRGARLHEQTTARRIKPGRKQVEITTEGGILRASAVVVATDLPQPNLRALHRHLRPSETTIVVVPALPKEVRAALGAAPGILRDCASPRHAWRVDRRGQLFLWQSHQPPVPQRQRLQASVQRSGQLMYEFSVRYPEISGLQPSHGWTLGAYRSVDGLVIAGPHRAFPRHLFAVGLATEGLQGAYLAARINLRHYLGASEKGDELFGFIR